VILCHGDGVRRWGSWEVIRWAECRAPVKKINTTRPLPLASQEEVLSVNQEAGPHQSLDFLCLDLGLPVRRTVRNDLIYAVVHLCPTVYGILL
jgi:hypothetical protein